MIIFGTGHRPEDCGYNMYEMRYLAEEAFTRAPEEVSVAVCGMAAGFDLAFGMAAMNLDISVWTVRPWAGHRPRAGDEDIYNDLLRYADRQIVTDDAFAYPGVWVYHKRNEWMVDNSDAGLAFWNGKESGGTYSCLKYAEKKGKDVLNIYPRTEIQ